MVFTVPLIKSKTYVIIRKTDSFDMLCNSITLTFSWRLWMAVGVAMVLLAVCLAAVNHLRGRYGNVEDWVGRCFRYAFTRFIYEIVVIDRKGNELQWMASWVLSPWGKNPFSHWTGGQVAAGEYLKKIHSPSLLSNRTVVAQSVP